MNPTTPTERRVLKWLRDGARIWAPARRGLAWVVLPDGHPDGEFRRVRVRTMHEMAYRELVVNTSGGTEYSDNVWELPVPVETA